MAHGGQNWQDFTTFESVVLGVGGAKFYQDALVKLDGKAGGVKAGTKVKEKMKAPTRASTARSSMHWLTESRN